ncbi:SDR family NAD(P)-dependent oxidoreductase [Zhouia sp. PK063]|uniref:SDR family NAD(P)-dependent oxidoreductase n=1 Tax=Zhouia sp. PK063 TaxID=3373602 RepID=UPI0037985F56
MKSNNYQGVLQQPINSGFDIHSSSLEVIKNIDLNGKTAIVTGGNTGIGLETVKSLVKAGAKVIVPSRDLIKAKNNLHGLSNVEIEELDLINPTSIDTFATKFLASNRPLHLLINNAGIMWVPLRRDFRGIESQLAINYLSQFQLTARLWPALKKAKAARIVNVSSGGHKFSNFNFEDPNFEYRHYETLQGYGQSKTAVNLFSLELDTRAKALGIRVFSLCPGRVGGTELAREASVALFQKMGYYDDQGTILPEVAASLKTVSQGAATTLWCATSPLLNEMGGIYCEHANIALLSTDLNSFGGVQEYSLDHDNAKKLWKWSEQVTGIRFSIE